MRCDCRLRETEGDLGKGRDYLFAPLFCRARCVRVVVVVLVGLDGWVDGYMAGPARRALGLDGNGSINVDLLLTSTCGGERQTVR